MRLLIFLSFFMTFSIHAAASNSLEHDDLSQLATQAKQQNLPILLIVSQHYCPFCVKLKEEIIHPMQISGDYEDKVIMTEIMMDSQESILDINGDKVRPGTIANSYKVWVTPTLLFLDHTGREIHKRMLGVNTIEMYGYYLDESLAGALKAVHEGDRSYAPTDRDVRGDAPGSDQLF